jgi:iron complex transport system substrate-binding protein
MSRIEFRVTVVLAAVVASQGGYNVTVQNCGMTRTLTSVPTRAITMNQGATEFMLAMGLHGSMVGTAYLDDAIWPRYAAAYAAIPVLSSSYPNETHIMAQTPDFIVGSYSSAFRAVYNTSRGERGIFSSKTVGPCLGNGSEWGQSWTTCRPQLHANGIGTYLFQDACEDSSMRPAAVTEETVYEEMRALASVFDVDAETLIADMKQDFSQAAGLISSGMHGSLLKTVWLDCVGRCCSVPEGQEEQVFVGGGTGAPNMLMKEAGLTNVFAERSGGWTCVNVSDIAVAKPDLIVVVDAAWDTAIDKIKFLYDDAAFCQLEVLRAARFVSIPFSATTLSPRNGPAALDLAVAALHVRTGSQTATQESGVTSFSPYFLQAQTACSSCPLVMTYVVYDDTTDSVKNYDLCTTTTMASTTTARKTPKTQSSNEEVSKAARAGLALWRWAAGGVAMAVMHLFLISA